MDLKVVFVIVFLSALAITSTHAGIPKCCIKVSKGQSKLLLKVERWERQYRNGPCDIDALIVYVKNRTTPYCVNPRYTKLLTKLMNAKKSQKDQTRGV
ncbi:hypothetical protein ATANTOWER_026833 [Ataeniobius toweri]|uniref:Chemokine interleukin-8-like domain-containing protein n=1 Tax=Ataeniobius toweri TaxID=208326 RepID=A0ABU7A8A4_9TELE|nr:hypothetical protein [Ataeniobius toweri]